MIVAVALTAAAIGLCGLVLHVSPYAERIDGVWRAGGPLEYPPALAVLSAAGLACALGLYVRGSLRTDTTAMTVLVLVMATLASSDRAGLALLTLTAGAFAWRHPQTRMLLGAAGVIVAAAIVLILAFHPHAGKLESNLLHNPFASRTNVWGDAIRGALRAPLTGYGPGQFPRVYTGLVHPPAVTLAHNEVLEQAADAGLLAAAGAIIVVLVGLTRCISGIRQSDPVALSLSLSSGAILASSMYDFTWSFLPLAVIAVVAMARLAPAASASHDEQP